LYDQKKRKRGRRTNEGGIIILNKRGGVKIKHTTNEIDYKKRKAVQI